MMLASVFKGMIFLMNGWTPKKVFSKSASLSFRAACQAAPKPGELIVRRSAACW